MIFLNWMIVITANEIIRLYWKCRDDGIYVRSGLMKTTSPGVLNHQCEPRPHEPRPQGCWTTWRGDVLYCRELRNRDCCRPSRWQYRWTTMVRWEHRFRIIQTQMSVPKWFGSYRATQESWTVWYGGRKINVDRESMILAEHAWLLFGQACSAIIFLLAKTAKGTTTPEVLSYPWRCHDPRGRPAVVNKF